MVPNVLALILCRFALGILSAQYMSLAISLIKEHFPDNLWKPYGAVYSAMRILGILLCYVLGQLFSSERSNNGNIFIFFGPAIISIIQATYLGYHLPESPVELLRAKQP